MNASYGYQAWLWISQCLMVVLLGLKIMECKSYFYGARQSLSQNELQDRFEALKGIKWGVAAEVLILVISIIGIQAWRVQ